MEEVGVKALKDEFDDRRGACCAGGDAAWEAGGAGDKLRPGKEDSEEFRSGASQVSMFHGSTADVEALD